MAKGTLLDAFFGREHPENDYYGNAGILRRHARLPIPWPVPGVIQHGWVGEHPGVYLDFSLCGNGDRSRAYFVWGRRNLSRCRALGFRNATAIGAPFLYLARPGVVPAPRRPRGLVLIPAHSCEWVEFSDAVGAYRGYLDEIERIRGRFDPVAAVLYWHDFRDARLVRLFEERGIRTVSFGHRNDPSFLRKFLSVVGEYAWMSSNSYNTALFYSLHMGRRAFVYGPQFRYRNADPAAGGRPPVHEQFSGIYPGLLWEKFDGEAHPEVAREELGAEFVRSPRALRRLMGWTAGRFLEGAYGYLLPRYRRPRLFFDERECGGLAGARTEMGGVEFLGRRRGGAAETLFFLARERPRTDLRVFVHAHPGDPSLLTPDRRPHGFFNLDHDPVVPAPRWLRGRVYADAVDLSVLPPGRYRLEVGLIDAEGGTVSGSADAGAVDISAESPGAP